MTVSVVLADLSDAAQSADVVAMTASYALDVMGNGGPLDADVLTRLVPALRAHPTTLVFLAYDDGVAVGIATCFVGMSTFQARSLINIHDLAVLPDRRGQGIGAALLTAVEHEARARGCCKLTLEVQERNTRARRAYDAAGFAQAVCSDATGGSLVYQKPL